MRAKRGGDLTGPNPTDRAERGTKYHVAVDGDGVPVACAATAANANDTLVFARLFLAAFGVMVRIGTVFADRGYDAEHHRALCRGFGAESHIHKRGRPSGSGLGKRRWPVGRSNARMLENRRLAPRHDRLGFVIRSLLQAACIFLVAGRLARDFWEPPHRVSLVRGAAERSSALSLAKAFSTAFRCGPSRMGP